MSDNESKPARGKRKGCLGKAISWFFTFVLIVVVGAVAVVFFVVPVNKLKLGNFDINAVTLGETTFGEVLEGSDITAYRLLNAFSKAGKADDALITNAPAQTDVGTAKQKIETAFGISLSDGETAALVAGVLTGETPSDETGIKKLLSFSDKETAALINLALNKYYSTYAEFEQIVLSGGTLSCVMSVDLTEYKQSLPDWMSGIIGFNELRIQSVYALSFNDGQIKAQNTGLTFGSLGEADTELLTKMLEPLVGGRDLSMFAADLFTVFVNNLGTVGTEISSPGIGGIGEHSVSIIVANYYF